MKKLKKVLLGLALVFVAIQFVRPAKNLSTTPPGKDDFIVRFAPPPEVKKMLEVGCYDCHSNNTRYPWYAELQPTAWWLKRHIDEGKEQLNLSEFGAYTAREQGKKIDAIIDQTEMRGMPLKSYTWVHRDAIFTEAQVKAFVAWHETLKDKIDADK